MKLFTILFLLIFSLGLNGQELINSKDLLESIEISDNENDYLNDIFLLIDSKNYRQALRKVNKLLQTNPTDPMLNYTKGFILNNLGKYKKASSSLTLAISVDSTRYEFYREIGSSFLFTKQYSLAIDYLEKAESFQFDDEHVFVLMSFSKAEINDIDGALTAIKKAIRINKNEIFYQEYRELLIEQLNE
jgi:superkiller protein 3